jgi:DNA-binding transcriptional regulator YiaG
MYHYRSCGLDNVYLQNGIIERKTKYGSTVKIEDCDGLHKAIARHLVNKPCPLSGKEFRFLRIEMDYSQKTLGALLDVSDQAIAKWEKGDAEIKRMADVTIRGLYSDLVLEGGSNRVSDKLRELAELDREICELEEKLNFLDTDEGWQEQEAA